MKDKQIKVSKKEILKEHKRIIPELKHAGLREEALKQAKEVKELRKK